MEMAKHNRWRVPGKYGARWVMVLMALAFLAFAAFLVARASFVARNGQRYFIIDDDELISLRYAWNLAHGHGLVWNPGERVEGFTDLLWTLYASAWAVVIPRRLLPLVMQVSGMALLLGQAAVFARIVRAMYAERGRTTPWMECAAFALPLAFYPLVYWSVQGMEVCLVGFLFSLAVLYYIRCRWVACAVALGLGFWTRPDVAVPAALIMGMAGIDALRDRRRLGQWLTSCGVLAGMVATVFILRRLYYGQTWPNTYVLKMQGLSLMDRITMNGIGYIMPFLRENILPLGIALAGIVLAWSWRRILFAAIVLSMIAYSVVVGGDTLPYWRFIAPFAPFLGLIFLTEGRDVIRHPAYRYALQTALLATLFISWIAASIKPFSEMNRGQLTDSSFLRPPSSVVCRPIPTCFIHAPRSISFQVHGNI